ncbi:hypothetical protein C8R47DRAFT_1324487 [Mycena vitilis]|nr:hypothetical protein C8R47DRAFT_1324487 [Mycena vitilis]
MPEGSSPNTSRPWYALRGASKYGALNRLMEPLIYRVLSVYDDCHGSPIRKGIRHSLLGVLSAIASRPALFQDHVRHIAVMSSLDSSEAGLAGITTVLSVSVSTINLALFYSGSPGLLPLLAQLPLKHLSLIREHFFPLPTATDYAHSAFSQVTHLDILDWRRRSAEWDPLTGVALIPHLTHLSFHDSGVTIAVCKHALADCKHLEVLAMLCRSALAVSRATRAREELAADPRIGRMGPEEPKITGAGLMILLDDVWRGKQNLLQIDLCTLPVACCHMLFIACFLCGSHARLRAWRLVTHLLIFRQRIPFHSRLAHAALPWTMFLYFIWAG